MKNRSASLLLSFLLLLTAAQTTRAQQPSVSDSRDKATDVTCIVIVNGAVRAPSRIEIRRRVRLLEALALAGGTTDQAGKVVWIIHSVSDSGCEKLAPDNAAAKPPFVQIYHLTEVLRGGDNANPYLQDGDLVFVHEAQNIYVVGSVVKPQAIPLRGPLTVTQAIAMVGGTIPDAKADGVRVIRYGLSKDERTEIRVNLKEIMRGRTEDLTLQPLDIVDVPSKRGGYAWPPTYDVKPKSNEILAKELPLRVVY